MGFLHLRCGVLRGRFCPPLAICLSMGPFGAAAADWKTSLPYPLLALLRCLWVKIALIKEVRERLHFTLTSGKFTVQKSCNRKEGEEGREGGRKTLFNVLVSKRICPQSPPLYLISVSILWN